MSLVLGPYPTKHAKTWTRKVHRRQPKIVGALWCIGLWVDAELRGVAIVGRPSARKLDSAAGERLSVLEVTRVAVLEGTRNACSKLYAACSQAARAMGADGIITYIHGDETGVSLRAAGWVKDVQTAGGEWDRDDRPRLPMIDPEPKTRWWAPWSKALRRPTVPISGAEFIDQFRAAAPDAFSDITEPSP